MIWFVFLCTVGHCSVSCTLPQTALEHHVENLRMNKKSFYAHSLLIVSGLDTAGKISVGASKAGAQTNVE